MLLLVAMSGSMVLWQLGSVLMSQAQITRQGHEMTLVWTATIGTVLSWPHSLLATTLKRIGPAPNLGGTADPDGQRAGEMALWVEPLQPSLTT